MFKICRIKKWDSLNKKIELKRKTFNDALKVKGHVYFFDYLNNTSVSNAFSRILIIHIRFSKHHNMLFLKYKTANFLRLETHTLLLYTTGAEELTRSRADPNFAGPHLLWPYFEPITSLNSVRITPLGALKFRSIRPLLSTFVQQLFYRLKLYNNVYNFYAWYDHFWAETS